MTNFATGDGGGSAASDGSQPEFVGLVDGALPASTRRFSVVLQDGAVVQLDDLLATTQVLPDGGTMTHYGIVVEGTRHIEGASFATDTARIAREQTMPGETARRVDVQVLRTVPELWLAPEPGSEVTRAAGTGRAQALFLDQMDQPLAVGLDQAGLPVYVDFAFLNGKKGGHVNISGISGVATKTSYALFLLYQLLETGEGRRLLGPVAPATRALVFAVKGEDLLQIDRPNNRFGAHPEAAAGWRALGVEAPGPFQSVALYAPRAAGAAPGSLAPDVVSRPSDEVAVYGWSPADFIARGLLEFCFAEDDSARTQVEFVTQRVRLQLARYAWPLAGESGAVLLTDPPPNCGFNFDKVVAERRTEREAGEGTPIRDFADLVGFLEGRVQDEDHDWMAGVQSGTALAFLRRLYALIPRIGHLIVPNVTPVTLERAAVSVVDIHGLHEAAQRFVVGALLAELFKAKQGTGREPLRLIVLDELNKYAPKEGRSPLKELLVDIAERGRSLGVLLIGAQQAATSVAPTIVRNAAVKVVGRLDAGEASEYRFLTPEVRERATRFLPGTMVLDQPLIPAPIPLRFPFPAFATSVEEGALDAAARQHAQADVFGRL
jgi:hypothetical protein